MPAAAGIASNCEHGEMDMWLANHVAGGNSQRDSERPNHISGQIQAILSVQGRPFQFHAVSSVL